MKEWLPFYYDINIFSVFVKSIDKLKESLYANCTNRSNTLNTVGTVKTIRRCFFVSYQSNKRETNL